MEKQITLSIFKPHIIKDNLIGKITDILEREGLEIVGMKMLKLSYEKAKILYGEHKNKSYFGEITKSISSSPVVIICLEGENAIEKNREIIGNANPKEASDKTIRKIHGKSIELNA